MLADWKVDSRQDSGELSLRCSPVSWYTSAASSGTPDILLGSRLVPTGTPASGTPWYTQFRTLLAGGGRKASEAAQQRGVYSIIY